MNCSFFLPQKAKQNENLQQNVFKELSKSCNTGRQERLPQKYTVQFFVIFYKQEWYSGPQCSIGTVGVHRSVLTHSLNERWLMSMMCQTLCHLPPYVVVRSSHYPHLTDEKTGGSGGEMTCPSSESQDSGRTGFWTRVWFQSSCIDSFNAPCCPPWETHQESLTSHYGAGDSWEWCCLHCRVPGWRLKLRQGAIPEPSGHLCSALSAYSTMKRREDLQRSRYITLQEQVCRDHQSFPGVTLMGNQRSQLWWDMHLRKSVMDLTDHSQHL